MHAGGLRFGCQWGGRNYPWSMWVELVSESISEFNGKVSMQWNTVNNGKKLVVFHLAQPQGVLSEMIKQHLYHPEVLLARSRWTLENDWTRSEMRNSQQSDERKRVLSATLKILFCVIGQTLFSSFEMQINSWNIPRKYTQEFFRQQCDENCIFLFCSYFLSSYH